MWPVHTTHRMPKNHLSPISTCFTVNAANVLLFHHWIAKFHKHFVFFLYVYCGQSKNPAKCEDVTQNFLFSPFKTHDIPPPSLLRRPTYFVCNAVTNHTEVKTNKLKTLRYALHHCWIYWTKFWKSLICRSSVFLNVCIETDSHLCVQFRYHAVTVWNIFFHQKLLIIDN